MRLLLNENVPLASAMVLREKGYDVLTITEHSPGITDQAVLCLAKEEERIVVTFDRDYGELIFRQGLPVPAGVLYLRFRPSSPVDPAKYIEQLRANGIVLEAYFTTGDRDQVRQRPLSHSV